MRKTLIVAAAAIILVGGSALAYKAYARHDGGHGRYHSRMSADDMNAYAAARIAALKAGLRLSAEQEKLWPPVESTLRELAGKRIERSEQFRSERRDRGDGADRSERRERPDPIERLRKGGTRLSEIGADLTRLADATEPLYQSLDDAQKRRFNRLARDGMRGGHHRREWRRHGDAGRHMGPRGYERDDDGDRGPRGRDRMEWREDAPRGAERL